MKELVKEIDLRLTSGYDPFKAEEKMNELVHGIKAEALIQENKKSLTLLEAFKAIRKLSVYKQACRYKIERNRHEVYL